MKKIISSYHLSCHSVSGHPLKPLICLSCPGNLLSSAEKPRSLSTHQSPCQFCLSRPRSGRQCLFLLPFLFLQHSCFSDKPFQVSDYGAHIVQVFQFLEKYFERIGVIRYLRITETDNARETCITYFLPVHGWIRHASQRYSF